MQDRAKYEQVFIPENHSYRIFHGKVPLSDPMPLHRHPVWEISHIIKGKGNRIVGDRLGVCNEGEVLVIAPDVPHCWIFSEDNEGWTENFTIQFRPEIMDSIGSLAEFSDTARLWKKNISACGGAVITDPAALRRIVCLTEGMEKTQDCEGILSLIGIIGCINSESVFRPVVSGCGKDGGHIIAQRKKGSAQDRMARVWLFILEHYADPIKLSDAASAASMSESAFCSFFRRTARMNFSDFLTQFRMEKVCSALLKDPSAPVAEIASSCGYSDIPHFNRVFRNYAGCSPREFRKMNSPERDADISK